MGEFNFIASETSNFTVLDPRIQPFTLYILDTIDLFVIISNTRRLSSAG